MLSRLGIDPRVRMALFAAVGVMIFVHELAPFPPLFKQEGYGRYVALVTNRPRPVRMHRPCIAPAFAPYDHPVDAGFVSGPVRALSAVRVERFKFAMVEDGFDLVFKDVSARPSSVAGGASAFSPGALRSALC
jgi:hypothetical protein